MDFLLLLILLPSFYTTDKLRYRLQLAPAGPGTLMCINEIFFAFLFGILIFDENPDYLSILGAVMIIAVSAGLGWRKWKLER